MGTLSLKRHKRLDSLPTTLDLKVKQLYIRAHHPSNTRLLSLSPDPGPSHCVLRSWVDISVTQQLIKVTTERMLEICTYWMVANLLVTVEEKLKEVFKVTKTKLRVHLPTLSGSIPLNHFPVSTLFSDSNGVMTKVSPSIGPLSGHQWQHCVF